MTVAQSLYLQWIKIWIRGIKSEVLVDSGASSNIISHDHWEQLKKSKTSSTNHTRWRRSYCHMGQQNHWPLWGFNKGEVWTETKSVEAEFVVVQSKGPTLGRQTSSQLKLLLLDHVQEKPVREIGSQISQVFQGNRKTP